MGRDSTGGKTGTGTGGLSKYLGKGDKNYDKALKEGVTIKQVKNQFGGTTYTIEHKASRQYKNVLEREIPGVVNKFLNQIKRDRASK